MKGITGSTAKFNWVWGRGDGKWELFVLFLQRFCKLDIKNEKVVKCSLQKCYKNYNTKDIFYN